MLDIFIGYDSREPIAYHVAAHSILRRSSVPVAIRPLVQSQLRTMGLYTRERGPTESTEFSLSRFLVPHLMGYKGFALFIDSDILCLTDIAELWKEVEENPGKAVWVCQHDYIPKGETKMDGQVQTTYPRKNWSSVMLFDCERCTMLTPQYVNTASGLELHRFYWVREQFEDIGALPLEWNVLIGEEHQSARPPKMIHFTNGIPAYRDYARCDYANEWFAEYKDMARPPLVGQWGRAAWFADNIPSVTA